VKTADYLLSDGMIAPFSKGDPQLSRDWMETATAIRKSVESCKVIVADNVATYTRARPAGYVLEEFPCLAPPWPEFWIEYPSVSGKQRRVGFVRDVTNDESAGRDGAWIGSLDDARRNGFEGDPKWVIEITALIQDQEHRVIGPAGWLVLALDDRGMAVGNRWVMGTPMGPMVVKEVTTYNGSPFDDQWLISAMLPTLQTISFLHCRNVVVETVEPPAKLSARYKQRHGVPLLRHEQVRLEVPRRVTGHPGSGSGQMGPAGLHIVAGHMAHYGDCHPPRPLCPQVHTAARCNGCGGHTAHGLLFGRHEGMYWSAQTMRGDPQREIRTDLELVVKDSA
jgi:hypothetical protein